MGKYNFSTQKFAELESRIEALEKVNNELRKENAALKNKSEPNTNKSIVSDINNYGKVAEIFGLIPTDKGLIKNDTPRTISTNFHTFWCNLMRAMMPKAYKATKDSNYRIVGKGLNELTDNEYAVFIETVEAVVDTVYYAKSKINNKEENNG